jgi:hypothetical protein
MEIIVATIDTIEYFTDKDKNKDVIDLFATIFADAIKLVVATLVAAMLVAITSLILVAVGVATLSVIGVIAAGMVVAFGIGLLLDDLDKSIGFTKTIDKGLHNSRVWVENEFKEAGKWMQYAHPW